MVILINGVKKLQQAAFVGVGIILLTSCTHLPWAKKMNKSIEVVEMPAASVTGTVLDKDLLLQGGDIALVPFKAGSQAEATEELDRLSLMIIKGIKESLDAQKTSLHVVEAVEGQPKIALQGYIEEYSKTGKLKRMILRPNQNSMRLTGEVWLISTGQRLLSFSTDKRFNPKIHKSINVAYELGKEIGDYIGSYAK